MDTLARAPGGQMRGAATKSMSDIVEERNKAAARPPPRPSGLRPAGPLALLLAPHIPRRVLLVARASPAGLGGQQQSVHIISSQTLWALDAMPQKRAWGISGSKKAVTHAWRPAGKVVILDE